MQIRRLSLENFRQFYGKQELRFATEPGKHVTIIHAENGFGKTTILNAVMWCFFEKVTPKFERPDEILNHEAAKEGKKFAVVEVEFFFESVMYVAHRTFSQPTAGVKGKTELAVFKVEKGVHKPPLDNPDAFMAKIIPEEMAKYFFFDGESAETFASAKNHSEIAKAIRAILGCTQADTAISDLKELIRRLDEQIGKESDDESIKLLELEIADKNEKIDKCETKLETIHHDIDVHNEMYEQIEVELRQSAGAKETQDLRASKEARLKEVNAEILECHSEILKWIGKNAIAVASGRLTHVAVKLIETNTQRGRIPSPYNEDFVKSLLRDHQCICNRPLPEGSPEWQAVVSLLSAAGTAQLESKVIRARARSSLLKSEGAEAPARLAAQKAKLARLIEPVVVFDLRQTLDRGINTL